MNRLDIARLFLFVREAVSQNNGQRVNAIQTWSGGAEALGTSWCAWFATMVLDLEYQGKAPIPRMGSCQAIRELAESNGWMADSPSAGDLFLYVDANDHAHHTGFYVGADTDGAAIGIAGNTDAGGTSDNGDRVAEHRLSLTSKILYVHLPESV